MGRRRAPAASLGFQYVASTPKRIRVVLKRADGGFVVDALATRAARDAAALLLKAIDTAEADKIAMRGDPTQKKPLPKRDGSRGLTKKRAVPKVTRNKRVENAALNLHSVLQDLLGVEGAPLRLMPDSDLSGGLIVSALQELSNALGKKGAPRIQKPKIGGTSL